jgi:uncharacterized protein (DUF362 family)
LDPVAIVRYNHDIRAVLEEGFNLIGGIIIPERPILLKPNLCTINDGTGHSVTDIEVVKTVVDLLFEINPNLVIRIIESDSQGKYAQDCFDKFGYTEFCRNKQKSGFDVSTVDLSRSPLVKISFEGDYFKDPELPEILTKPHYFISIAVAKTHYLSYITGVLKNLFGVLPRKDQSFYHPEITEVITDLARIIRPEMNIVDARVGVEDWNGPTTHQIGAFVIGRNPVSVDAVMTKIFQLNPKEVLHLQKLEAYNFGSLHTTTVGLTIDDVKVKFSKPKIP